MKKIYAFAAALLLGGTVSFSQTFSNGSSILPGTYHSGGVTGVADVNNDGLDDIIVMDQSVHVYVLYQQNDGTFQESDYGQISNSQQWGMCVGDKDNDGFLDIQSGGNYDGVHFLDINSVSSATQQDFPAVQIFMQACNFADINNDGWLDAFACHDDGEAYIFQNDGAGNMTNGNSLIDMTIYPNSDNSGNYGTTWTDFDRDGDIDLFIAKCRQFVNDPLDPRRTNVLLVNDGNNNYHDEAALRGLVNLQQSWTSDFADVDNDGDFDAFITTHSGTIELYENDGFGYFTNITAGSGLEISGFFLQGKLDDLDNDGYVDVLYGGGISGYLHNNGDKTFTAVNNLFPGSATVHSFGFGDLNNDGWLDIYTTYGSNYVTPSNTADRIYLSNGGTNHWLSFDLQGTISNRRAVGALVEIHGSWGTQIREVRAGESYGISNSFKCHFGLGASADVDYAVIYWPAGGITVIDNPQADMVHLVTETQCTPPTASISANGPTTFCPGGSVTLAVASANGSYHWNNGASSASLVVTEQGNYSVIVSDAQGCGALSNVVSVDVAEEPVPTVAIQGDVEFCQGLDVTLVASEGSAYLWSNGATTQSITVSEAGDYTVQVTGNCQSAPSDAVSVVVFSAPSEPTVSDVTINSGSTATLVANGTDIRWYDSLDGVTPIATGNTFVTPAITSNTSYWVEDVTTHGGNTGIGGPAANTASGLYFNNTNRYMIFDVYEDLTLQTVKVYAQSAGVRTIEVRDALSNIIATGDFNIEAGEQVVALNFNIPAGTNYGIYCTSANPGMWRDESLNTDLPFPYDLGGLGAITSSSVTGDNANNYYYFFYDWHVATPEFECAGPRHEVQVIILGVGEIQGLTRTVVYPNPANSDLNVAITSEVNGAMQIKLIDQTGRIVTSTRQFISNGSNIVRMDVSDVAAGVYQVQFEMNGQTSSRKLIVE